MKEKTRKIDLSRVGRVVLRALGSTVLLGAIAVGIPAPADAHGDGHVCVNEPLVPNTSGWGCIAAAAIEAEPGVDRSIWFYYGHLVRGNVGIHFAPGSTRATEVRVCDYESGDHFRPAIAVNRTVGTVLQFTRWSEGCSTYDVDFIVEGYKGLTRNSTTGSVQHGTLWYTKFTGA